MYSGKIDQRTLNKFGILSKLSYMFADETRIYLIVLLRKLQMVNTITMKYNHFIILKVG